MDYTVYSLSWTIQSTVYHGLYSVQFITEYTVYNLSWIIQCTVYHGLYSVQFIMDYTVYSYHGVYNVQFIMDLIIQCTVSLLWIILCTLKYLNKY